MKSSGYKPTASDIIAHGNRLSSVGNSLTYMTDFAKLTPSTTYKVYVTGQEELGTRIKSSVDDTILVFTTLSTSDSSSANDSSEANCPYGLSLTDHNLFETMACSGHGTCEHGVCTCHSGYTGATCNDIQEIQRDFATRTEWLLHSDWQMSGTVVDGDSELTVWKTATREMVARQMQIPASYVQIREWTLFYTQLPSLASTVPRKHRLADVHSSTPFLLNVKLSCVIPVTAENAFQDVEEDRLTKLLSLTQFHPLRAENAVQVESSRLLRTALQTAGDSWTCYDGRVGQDESDVDCGGSCVARCSTGMKCESHSDCQTSLSCSGGVCNAFTFSSFTLSIVIAVAVVVVLTVVMSLYYCRQSKVCHFS